MDSGAQISAELPNWAILATIVFIVVLYLMCFIIIYPVLKARKKYGKDQFLFLDKFRFAGGLNLPQNVSCGVFCLRSKIVIASSGQEFSLSAEKLIDVSVMTTTEIQKQYVSSVGGAVAGAMLLGPLGAVLGGAASKRSIRTNTRYLIFTYRDQDDIKYILFDVTKRLSGAKRFERKFRALKKNNDIKINL